MQNSQALGALPPVPRVSGGWGLCPQTPTNSTLNCKFLPTRPPHFALFIINHMGFRSFCFEQFFLHCSVANLMMLTTIDVCLMLNCFFFEKFYSHYALCDFDSILLHCTKLFICQSIDREQIFDVTFEKPPIEKSCVRH